MYDRWVGDSFPLECSTLYIADGRCEVWASAWMYWRWTGFVEPYVEDNTVSFRAQITERLNAYRSIVHPSHIPSRRNEFQSCSLYEMTVYVQHRFADDVTK